MRAFGLPHFGQTSRCGTVILGVLLRFWRRSAGIVSGCIGVLLIISNRRQPVAPTHARDGQATLARNHEQRSKALPLGVRQLICSCETPLPHPMTLHETRRIQPAGSPPEQALAPSKTA